jgi:hypothetical protein
MGTSPPLSPTDIEARTVRKVRNRIVPFIMILMVIASLDRMNIGFAALTMNKELAISSQQYGFLAGIFSLATSRSRYPAICCCTGSEHVSGLLEYSSVGELWQC